MAALQKKVLWELGEQVGIRDHALRREWERLKATINDRFWDDRIGFYFDYDHAARKISQPHRGIDFGDSTTGCHCLRGLFPKIAR